MRVLVDGWELAPGRTRRGIGRFLAGLLPRLAATGVGEVGVLQRADESRVPAGTHRLPVTRRVPRSRVRTAESEHLTRLPLDLARIDHDVFVSPGTLPPMWAPAPWLQVIHDLAPLVRDDRAYVWDRRRWRLLGGRIRAADTVVTPSRFSADEAMHVLGLDAGSVEVIPHGVDEAVFRPDGPDDELAGREPSLMAVVAEDPRKGLDEAVAVAGRLAAMGRPHPLHLAGRLSPSVADRLARRAPAVIVRGFVDDLPALLRAADVALVTSRYEGFGFVAVEAMACGTPVVAFDNTAIGEVVGDGGVLVADGDVSVMTTAVGELLDSEAARHEWSRRGLARAAEFDWDRAADAYATVLDDVTG